MLFFDLRFDVGVVHERVKLLVVLVHGDESAEGLFVVVDVGLYGVYGVYGVFGVAGASGARGAFGAFGAHCCVCSLYL